MQTREDDQSTSQLTKALSAVKLEPLISIEKSTEQIINDAMSLYVKKFGTFLRKSQGSHQRSYQKRNKLMIPMLVSVVAIPDIS